MATQTLQPQTIDMPVEQAFEDGFAAWDVMLTHADNRPAICLYDWQLIEDDGPGASGGDDLWRMAASDTIRQGRQIKKILHIDRPESMSRHLSIYTRPLPGETRPLQVVVNPENTDFAQTFQIQPNNLKYQVVELESQTISAGDNEIILSCDGPSGWRIYLAKRDAILQNAPQRDTAPQRSFLSTDDGRAWTPQLGNDNNLDGEYQVRLSMRQYVAQGTFISPVIDLAAQADSRMTISPAVEVKTLKLQCQEQLPPGTYVQYAIRTGHAPVFDPQSWGDWIDCSNTGEITEPIARFVQWRAILSTDTATLTPLVESVSLHSETATHPVSWAADLKILDAHNPQPRYTSIPFEYERFDHPALAELREKYRLDEVVAGVETELEKMIKLRHWVSQQWQYDPPTPPYPAIDAREILERKQGFCVQYAVTFMQCALSLGYPTRFVFGNFPQTTVGGKYMAGHEVNEFWSSQYNKWIMLDAHQDECYVSRQTGIPLSMLELHEESLQLYFGDKTLTYTGTTLPRAMKSPNIQRWKGEDPAPEDDQPEIALKWGTVRWLPRNNYLEKPCPAPLTQGINTWPYTGYWQWEDRQTPRRHHYRRYTSRRSDIDWTLNQVRFAASYTRQPGVIDIVMGTVTPDFATYEIQIDGGPWQPTGDQFQWHLKPGRNHLALRSRNRAGVVGAASFLEVEYVD